MIGQNLKKEKEKNVGRREIWSFFSSFFSIFPASNYGFSSTWSKNMV